MSAVAECLENVQLGTQKWEIYSIWDNEMYN